MNCALCQRELISGPSIDEHHLIPKLKGGKKGPKVTIHKVCHRFIHATFTEGELARTYNTIEVLLSHESIQKFVRWIAKKQPDYMDSIVESKDKKKKRRK